MAHQVPSHLREGPTRSALQAATPSLALPSALLEATGQALEAGQTDLETAGGLSNVHANMLSAAQWIIIIFVTFCFSMIVDKVNQRWLYCFGVSMAVLAWLIIVTVGIKGMAGLLFFTLLWAIQAGVSVQSFYAWRIAVLSQRRLFPIAVTLVSSRCWQCGFMC